MSVYSMSVEQLHVELFEKNARGTACIGKKVNEKV
jgi:hypothetical protein